jgi:hypothetical protein
MGRVLLELLWFVLPLVLFTGYALFVVVRRGLEWRELVEEGVDATAVVVRKRRYSRTFQLAYEYVDPDGVRHSHHSMVVWDVFNRYEVGDEIPIVYARRRPRVSAPRYLVDASREALQRRRTGGR